MVDGVCVQAVFLTFGLHIQLGYVLRSGMWIGAWYALMHPPRKWAEDSVKWNELAADTGVVVWNDRFEKVHTYVAKALIAYCLLCVCGLVRAACAKYLSLKFHHRNHFERMQKALVQENVVQVLSKPNSLAKSTMVTSLGRSVELKGMGCAHWAALKFVSRIADGDDGIFGQLDCCRPGTLQEIRERCAPNPGLACLEVRMRVARGAALEPCHPAVVDITTAPCSQEYLLGVAATWTHGGACMLVWVACRAISLQLRLAELLSSDVLHRSDASAHINHLFSAMAPEVSNAACAMPANSAGSQPFPSWEASPELSSTNATAAMPPAPAAAQNPSAKATLRAQAASFHKVGDVPQMQGPQLTAFDSAADDSSVMVAAGSVEGGNERMVPEEFMRAAVAQVQEARAQGHTAPLRVHPGAAGSSHTASMRKATQRLRDEELAASAAEAFEALEESAQGGPRRRWRPSDQGTHPETSAPLRPLPHCAIRLETHHGGFHKGCFQGRGS